MDNQPSVRVRAVVSKQDQQQEQQLQEQEQLCLPIKETQLIKPLTSNSNCASVESNQLALLANIAKQPEWLDALMLADRMDSGIWTSLLAFISVFRIPNVDWTLAVHSNQPNSTLYPPLIVRLVRWTILLVILLLPGPYAAYVNMVPSLMDSSTDTGYSNPFFLIFMTLINLTPFACWCSFQWLVYRKNKVTLLRLHLLRFSIVHHANKVEHVMQRFAELTKNGRQMLQLMEQEIKSLELLGMDGIKEQQRRNAIQWNMYMKRMTLWTACLCVVYLIWDSMYVFGETCNSQYSSVCFIFLIMWLTSPLRFGIPLIIMAKFTMECTMIIQRIEQFVNLHKNNKNNNSIVERCNQWSTLVQTLERMAHWWQGVFLTSVGLPLVSMIIVVAATLRDSNIVHNEWFFLVYCVHYSIFALFVFHQASSISSSTGNMSTVLREWQLQDLVHFDQQVDNQTRVQEYWWYLSHRYSGFKVGGVTITESLSSQLRVVLIAIITWLSDNVAQR